MYRVWRLGEAAAFLLFYITQNFVLMPNPTNLEQKRSTVTSTSTLTADVKALFILLLLVLTIINPMVFVIPFALCVLSGRKGGVL